MTIKAPASEDLHAPEPLAGAGLSKLPHRAPPPRSPRDGVTPTSIGRRRFVAGSLAATAALFGCAQSAQRADHPREFDAIVATSEFPGVDIARFTSIAAAIAAAPREPQRAYRIRITPGLWHEKITVDRPWIHLIGDDRERCELSFDAAAGQRGPDGEPWGTWGCASLIVRAPDFHASRLRIANRFDYVNHLAHPVFEPIGSSGAQGVALMLAADSDRALLDDVDIIGHQDTLFVDAGRSVFRRCRISGSVDFVFGAGVAWFDRCELISRYRPGKPRQGYVAVPSTVLPQAHGLIFDRCRLLREALVPDSSVALGRPWRPTRTFVDGRYGDPNVSGSAVFRDCWMDAHIDAHGWDEMAYTARDGSRVGFDPLQARLAEFGSRGPGARVDKSRPLLPRSAALRLSERSVFGDWRPV
ncbi:MAG: pectinesterase family protein [Tahibacter sp.]